MRAELDALVHELKALRQEGVDAVYVQPESLQRLARTVTELERAGREQAQAGAAAPGVTLADFMPEASKSNAPAPKSPGASVPKKRAKRSPLDGLKAIPPAPEFEVPDGTRQERWEWLRDHVLACPTCNEHLKPGKKVVFGVGNIEADIFFCGEAPGAEEEVQGEPFVGPAGQLLTKIIQAMGLTRDDVYIGNIMNWRPEMPTPTGNRQPEPEEMAFCLPYIRAQIQIVQPKVIVALGSTAVKGLLGEMPNGSIGRARGNWFEFEGTPLLPTFHPSYLLRNDTLRTKRQVWEDMMRVMERVGMPVSEKQKGFFLKK